MKTECIEVQVLKNEINWCKKNPDKTLSPDFQRGFTKGLQQAINLINKSKKVMLEEK